MPVEAEPKTVTLQLPIEGMTCASCSTRVQRGLSRLPGMTDAAVNLATEKATVTYDPAQLDQRGIVEAVHDIGYGVRLERQTLHIGDMSCASCVTRVEKALQATPGVMSAAVNFATETAAVEYVPGTVTQTALR